MRLQLKPWCCPERQSSYTEQVYLILPNGHCDNGKRSGVYTIWLLSLHMVSCAKVGCKGPFRMFLDMPNRRTGQSIERGGKVASYVLNYTELLFASI